MDTLNMLTEWWNEYSPIVISIGGTLLAVGGIILTAYLKFKPVLTAFKEKLDTLFDKATDVDKEDISTTLQSVSIDGKITDLKEKIANPLTSESARASYTTQLETLIKVKTKLDNGLVTVSDVNDKF